MELQRITSPELVFPHVEATDRRDLLAQLAGRLEAQGWVKKPAVLLQRLLEREELGTTGLGHGVAIPHCKLPGLSEVIVAVAACPDGVDFGAEDGELVRLVFLVVSPANAPADHLRSLAAISRWVRQSDVLSRLHDLGDRDAIYRSLASDDPAGAP